MDASIWLGPAGSGKTWKCLEEIRDRARNNPSGPPLILLAPKQATFQLERQLLDHPDAPQGFSRVRILSFPRLADWVLEQLNLPAPTLLDEEGRIMIFRALLLQLAPSLRRYRASSEHPGTAMELSRIVREFQRHRIPPERLRDLANRPGSPGELPDKLHDLSLLHEAYLKRLQELKLRDMDALPDLASEAAIQATEAARQGQRLHIEGLWMDGFADLTPQERHLLGAVGLGCDRMRLAFCLPSAEPGRGDISSWSALTETMEKCRKDVADRTGHPFRIEILQGTEGRFSANPVLAHLEKNWDLPRPRPGTVEPHLQAISCEDATEEAHWVARELVRVVREEGLRFRECAIMARDIGPYLTALRRWLPRLGIPFFLDQREPVKGHPLSELTRTAVTILAYGWRHEDVFTLLKTGLLIHGDRWIDHLENEALRQGWKGPAHWNQPLPSHGPEWKHQRMERVRSLLALALGEFREALGKDAQKPSGKDLASAIRKLWKRLRVERRLERWASQPGGAIHATVLEAMDSWLNNLELAFGTEQLGLQEWATVMEAGLASLSVGLIPPTVDQVLVGSIDRSRNPDLKRLFFMGFNDGAFPAPPRRERLLDEEERDWMRSQGCELGPDSRKVISREKFLGYIACTRPREKLCLTWRRRSDDQRPMAPSPFLHRLVRLFPDLSTERAPEIPPAEAEKLPPSWRRFDQAKNENQVPVETLQALLGEQPTFSITQLETRAACPFRFYVSKVLRGKEREVLDRDPRQRGSFQHELLHHFHLAVTDQGKTWKDLTDEEVETGVQTVADQLLESEPWRTLFSDTLGQHELQGLLRAMQRFLRFQVQWLRNSDFRPWKTEFSFGPHESAPGQEWIMKTEDGRPFSLNGRVDRVDLAPSAQPGGASEILVIDYKSSGKKYEAWQAEAGLNLQLPLYLGYLQEHSKDFSEGEALLPAGMFYVPLRPTIKPSKDGQEAESITEQDLLPGFKFTGHYLGNSVERLDHRCQVGTVPAGPIPCKLTKEGKFHGSLKSPLTRESWDQALQHAKDLARQLGTQILNGDFTPDPFEHGRSRACDHCDFKTICRLDPQTHRFRVVGNEESSEEEEV